MSAIGSKSSTALKESLTHLNEAIQAYAEAIRDAEFKLSIEIFKQGQDMQNTLSALFDQMMSFEPEIRALAGHCLTDIDWLIADESVIHEKAQQDIDYEFFCWLSPSYWEVENKLKASQQQRQEGTVSWVLEMPEFKNWLNAELDYPLYKK